MIVYKFSCTVYKFSCCFSGYRVQNFPHGYDSPLLPFATPYSVRSDGSGSLDDNLLMLKDKAVKAIIIGVLRSVKSICCCAAGQDPDTRSEAAL